MGINLDNMHPMQRYIIQNTKHVFRFHIKLLSSTIRAIYLKRKSHGLQPKFVSNSTDALLSCFLW